MFFYQAKEVADILEIAESTAYKVIHHLQEQLVSAGYSRPKAGKIQKKFFCEQYQLDLAETDLFLQSKKEADKTYGNARTSSESRINPALQ